MHFDYHTHYSMPKNSESTPSVGMHSAEIVECVMNAIAVNGLDKAMSYFEGMEHILSRASFWSDVKKETDALFTAERKRQEQRELERLRAGAPIIVQNMPTATSGVDKNYGPIVDGGTVNLEDINKYKQQYGNTDKQ